MKYSYLTYVTYQWIRWTCVERSLVFGDHSLVKRLSSTLTWSRVAEMEATRSNYSYFSQRVQNSLLYYLSTGILTNLIEKKTKKETKCSSIIKEDKFWIKNLERNWRRLHQWAGKTGLDVVACISPRFMSNDSELDLVSLTDRMGFNASWQLGYGEYEHDIDLRELRVRNSPMGIVFFRMPNEMQL